MADLLLDAAAAELARRDPRLAPVIAAAGPCPLRPAAGAHLPALIESILHQQLAGGAAAAISRRFAALAGEAPDAQTVASLDDEQLRAAGLSRQKGAAIRDLAAHVVSGALPLEDMGRLSDSEVVDRLIQVRRLGVWTAHMFLIFQLGRPDVWPIGDYGVRQGYALVHDLPELPPPARLEPLGEVYRPHRSLAAWYMWRALELSRHRPLSA